MAGLIAGLPPERADSFVLALPLSVGDHGVALIAYLGGLSAATAMVIVETVAVLWSLTANSLGLIIVSLFTQRDALERLQASLFVEVHRNREATRPWQGEARVAALRDLLIRFLGPVRADAVMAIDERRRGRRLRPEEPADASLIQLGERQLARAIGAASARAVVGSIVHGEVLGPLDLMEILDETSRVLDYSRRLELKSRELERATAELRRANERLQEADQLRDDFIATVSHELCTPLTSIRSFTEIMHDNPDLTSTERQEFLAIVVRETERLTRLIDDLLGLSRMEQGRMDWRVGAVDLRLVIGEAARASEALLAEKRISLDFALTDGPLISRGDADRLLQVLLNLLSNAAKFTSPNGHVRITAEPVGGDIESVLVRVDDDGPGVPEAWRETMFEKFRQVSEDLKTRPRGSGLGLAICRQIIERFDGRIWAEESPLGGAGLCFTLPMSAAE